MRDVFPLRTRPYQYALRVMYTGEGNAGALGYPGPYRAALDEVCRQMVLCATEYGLDLAAGGSSALGAGRDGGQSIYDGHPSQRVLLPVPNSTQNIGRNRERLQLTPHIPSDDLERYLQTSFCAVGQLFGLALRSTSSLALDLSSSVWNSLYSRNGIADGGYPSLPALAAPALDKHEGDTSSASSAAAAAAATASKLSSPFSMAAIAEAAQAARSSSSSSSASASVAPSTPVTPLALHPVLRDLLSGVGGMRAAGDQALGSRYLWEDDAELVQLLGLQPVCRRPLLTAHPSLGSLAGARDLDAEGKALPEHVPAGESWCMLAASPAVVLWEVSQSKVGVLEELPGQRSLAAEADPDAEEDEETTGENGAVEWSAFDSPPSPGLSSSDSADAPSSSFASSSSNALLVSLEGYAAFCGSRNAPVLASLPALPPLERRQYVRLGHAARRSLRSLALTDTKAAEALLFAAAPEAGGLVTRTPYSWAEFNDYLEMTHSTTSADCVTSVDLGPQGRRTRLSYPERAAYAACVLGYRATEGALSAASVRAGLNVVIPSVYTAGLTLHLGRTNSPNSINLRPASCGVGDDLPLGLFSPRELELQVCGDSSLDLTLLKALTNFKMSSGSQAPPADLVANFWRALESFTDEQRTRFLQFVWGMGRLPRTMSDNKTHMTVQISSDQGRDDRMPTSHTCFMTLELPWYSNFDVLFRKLSTAIYCNEINY